MKAGETEEECLIRECLEESGYEVKVGKCICYTDILCG